MNDNNPALVVPEMTNDEHHASDAIGSTGLKLLDRSPFHYWSEFRDPNRVRRDPTPAMKLGTAWHAAIFEPEAFARDYIELPEGLDRRTKEGKALWADIQASGKEPLKADEYATILRMAESARKHPVSVVLFDQIGGVAEQSHFWTDPETGVRCKIRPDYAIMPCAQFPNGLIVDGKTTGDASPTGFPRAAWDWKMHIQAAFYADGFQAVHGTDEPPAFLWLAQEKDAPYPSAYYSAGADIIAYGRKKCRQLMRLYAACLASDKWPGYPAEVNDLSLPVWAQKEIADALAA